jgi:hypothetical protein
MIDGSDVMTFVDERSVLGEVIGEKEKERLRGKETDSNKSSIQGNSTDSDKCSGRQSIR